MEHQYKSYSQIYLNERKSRAWRWCLVLVVILTGLLFLPWTQNIRGRGVITTLYQQQRPQQVNTLISGGIVKWYVKEGDFVKKGDTILHLAEVKAEYLDPELLKRTREQIDGKQLSVEYYRSKVSTADQQVRAITNTLPLKLSQLKNKLAQLSAKVQADSAENLAALTESQIAATQLDRQRAMYDSGLVSLTQLELRKLQFQSAMAKKASAENKLASSRQELLITATEMNFQQQDNQQEMAKAEGEKFQSLTAIASSQADLAKLRNEYSNYQVRNGMYFITAPQSGQIVKAKKAGIGEFVKDGDMIAEIVPQDVQYAVDIYVEPVDLPLLSKGQKMRLVFDGFPAIVFSGWPEASSGTFAGEIAAVETNLSANGKFRLIVKEDPGDRPWPQQLKIGTGATGIGLLADVPLWYELWRNINGFPADFYTPEKLKGKPGQP